MIPYGRQSIGEDDIEAVEEVLRGGWLTQGPAVDQFERDLTAATGAAHAVAFANGTAALHAACAAAGLGPGDRVVTSPLTFAASANCARYVGADVGLVDIDPATWNIDLAGLPQDCDAAVVVHYAGLPVDLRELGYRPSVVIEDAAHAFGAKTPDGPVGNCAHSDMCCFSFHPVKTITTGEGGAVTTNSAVHAAALRTFRHHGIVANPSRGAWVYDIPSLGFNYRLTDIQAALGSSQLQKLDRFVARRNELASRYRELLAGSTVGLPPEAPDGFVHGRHLFPVVVESRDLVFAAMRQRGIGVQVHYVPIYALGAYADLGCSPADLPHTDALYRRLISLPMFPDLTEEDQDRVVTALLAVL